MSDVAPTTEPTTVEPVAEPVAEETPATEVKKETKKRENYPRFQMSEIENLSDEELKKIVEDQPQNYPKPNYDNCKKAQEKVEEEIQALYKKVNDYREEIKKIINDRKNKKNSNASTRTDMYTLIDKSKELKKQRNSFFDTLKVNKERLTKLNAIQNDQKKHNRTGNTDDILEEIERLEDSISAGLSPNEEAACYKKIKALKQELDETSHFQDVKPEIDKLKAENKTISAQLDENKKALDEIQSNIDTLKAVLEESKNKPTEEDPVKNLYLKIDEFQKEIGAKKEAKKEIYVKFNENRDNYYKNLYNVNKHRAAKRLLEDREYEREEAARKAEAEAEALKRPPFEAQMDLCNAMIAYCESLLPTTHKAATPAAPKPKVEGLWVKKEEDYFVGSKENAKKTGKKPAKKPAKKPMAISHSLESLAHFQELRIAIPATYEDLPRAIEHLKKRLDLFTNLERGSNVEEALAKQEL